MSLSNSTMKVKVILGNDIRRWRYEKSKSQLSALKEFVQSSFNLNNFWLQYEDDEGDRLTLSSNTDFQDAFDCAMEEERKSLKIYVIEGSIQYAQRKDEPKPSPVQSPPQQKPQSQSQPQSKCNFAKSSSCSEMRSSVINFLQNPEIVKLLPELFRRLMAEIKKAKQAQENKDKNKDEKSDENDDVNNIPVPELKWNSSEFIENLILTILSDKQFNAITSHELYNKKIKTMIPMLSGKICTHLPMLINYPSDSIASWISHITSIIIPALSSFNNIDFNIDSTSIAHAFFPLWGAFMRSHGDHSGIDVGLDCYDDNGNPIHLNVTCDGCQVNPIKGVRYKCCICENYDLCGQCESFGKHPSNHPMIKFNKTSSMTASPPFLGLHEIMRTFGHGPHHWFGNHWKRRFGRGHHGNHHGHHRGGRHNSSNSNNNQQSGGFQPHHPHNPHGQPPPHGPPHGWWNHDQGGHRGHRAWKKWNRWGNNNNSNQNQWGQQQQQQNNPWGQWCQNRQSQNNETSQSQNQAPISSTIPDKKKDDILTDQQQQKKIKVMADFVRDVTLPDRTYYPTDTVLTKTWKMKNNGLYPWGNNVELVFFKGNESLTLEKRYPVINASPGECVEVSAVIKTPCKPGRYCSYYRLQRNGEYFGPRVWVDIFAIDEKKSDHLPNKKKNKKEYNQKCKSLSPQNEDKKIKNEKKDCKLERKKLKLEAKQNKLNNKLNDINKKLDKQNENDNSFKLIKKQQKLQQQVNKLSNKVEFIDNKRNSLKDINNIQIPSAPSDEELFIENIANDAINDILLKENDIDSNIIQCVCGNGLIKTSPMTAYNNPNSRVNCDICGKFCHSKSNIYHCPNQKSLSHPEGYDLCSSCVEYQYKFVQKQQQKQKEKESVIAIPDIVEPEPVEQVEEPKNNEESDDFIYKDALKQLQGMGFDDIERIKAELIQQKGNVQRVANRLLLQ